MLRAQPDSNAEVAQAACDTRSCHWELQDHDVPAGPTANVVLLKHVIAGASPSATLIQEGLGCANSLGWR
jgi:hypothetical protein